MSKGVSKYDDVIPMDLGVIAGNLKKREIWMCLKCPKEECDCCGIHGKKMIWDSEVANDLHK